LASKFKLGVQLVKTSDWKAGETPAFQIGVDSKPDLPIK
jgi:hypothetical protein